MENPNQMYGSFERQHMNNTHSDQSFIKRPRCRLNPPYLDTWMRLFSGKSSTFIRFRNIRMPEAKKNY